ncbi:MAG: CpXC domain-containing protein [Thermodesulfobacteriota bacterium]|nr:CpXC domain-containing protein [Thermodesulfobacteriota bacterium]
MSIGDRKVDVICTGCNQHYKIAEEKLPSDSVAYFTCPNCKKRIKIEAPSRRISLSTNKKTVTSESQGFEYFEPGTKTALVYCPESQERELLQKELTGLGYEVRLINQQDDIRFRFRYHRYDLIILYQNGPEPEDDLVDIREYINSLLADMRRKIFVIYVHSGGDRLDSMQAFSMGADLIISPSDLVCLSEILFPALDAKEIAYKVFSECKAKMEEEIF